MHPAGDNYSFHTGRTATAGALCLCPNSPGCFLRKKLYKDSQRPGDTQMILGGWHWPLQHPNSHSRNMFMCKMWTLVIFSIPSIMSLGRLQCNISDNPVYLRPQFIWVTSQPLHWLISSANWATTHFQRLRLSTFHTLFNLARAKSHQNNILYGTSFIVILTGSAVLTCCQSQFMLPTS